MAAGLRREVAREGVVEGCLTDLTNGIAAIGEIHREQLAVQAVGKGALVKFVDEVIGSMAGGGQAAGCFHIDHPTRPGRHLVGGHGDFGAYNRLDLAPDTLEGGQVVPDGDVLPARGLFGHHLGADGADPTVGIAAIRSLSQVREKQKGKNRRESAYNPAPWPVGTAPHGDTQGPSKGSGGTFSRRWRRQRPITTGAMASMRREEFSKRIQKAKAGCRNGL